MDALLRFRAESLLEQRHEIQDELKRRRLVTPAEAGFMLNKSKGTINRWIRAGLKTETVEGVVYVSPADARAWMTDPSNRTRRRTTPLTVQLMDRGLL